jgi:hypothetical protein
LAKGDFRRALFSLREHQIDVVELSALRIGELAPLLSAWPDLDLQEFQFVSIHAPSRFEPEMEERVVSGLAPLIEQGYPVVAHPDVLFTPALWSRFGNGLFIENMDKRKVAGRTVRELAPIFEELPMARFCFDIGHARQVDPSMTEARLLLHAFGDRLAEVHMSEVDTVSRHQPISHNAITAFQSVAEWIPAEIPVVLEMLIDGGQGAIETELQRAQQALIRGNPGHLP